MTDEFRYVRGCDLETKYRNLLFCRQRCLLCW